jgi:hypothetical protein
VKRFGDMRKAESGATLLLMLVGENPLIVRKLRYYADKELPGMFDAA